MHKTSEWYSINYSKLKRLEGKEITLIIQRQEKDSLQCIVYAESEIRKEVIFFLSLDPFQITPWYSCKPLYIHKNPQFLDSVNWMTNSWMESLIATSWHTRESQQKDNSHLKENSPSTFTWNNSRSNSVRLMDVTWEHCIPIWEKPHFIFLLLEISTVYWHFRDWTILL